MFFCRLQEGNVSIVCLRLLFLPGNVSKHVAVIHALSQLVNERMLLEVSSLEQEIACREAKNEHFAQVSEFLQNSRVSNMDKLRLVLLFSLRYALL